MTFGQYVVAQVGNPKWVLAARTSPRIERQYPGAVVIHPKRYEAMRKAYRAEFGDPDDKVRADLYLCLLDLQACAPEMPEPLKSRVTAALEAERNAG